MTTQPERPGQSTAQLAETDLAPGREADAQFEALLHEVMRPEAGAGTCQPGDQIGRYRLVREIGRGGFGVVFQARDVELNRDVALKVLRLPHGPLGGLDIARLLREAKAMARLKHPNVVTVYEVGVSGHHPFLAMELVEGLSMRAWLRAGRRSWRETLSGFAQAGRGLAAAHAAGLVHRDFKPDNVLVGDDGVVRVADFGLARRFDDDAPDAVGDEAPAALGPLTVAGAVAGTPLYMAPEQHRGEPPDGRTDQFSFCLALYEALYAEHPFGGQTPDTIRAAVLGGVVRRPARGARVPRFLRAALLRGLRVGREERFPSMDALLAAIALEPRARRARALGAAVALLMLVVVGVLVVRAREHARSQLCKGGPAMFAGAWDEPRRAAVQGAFLSSGSPDAEPAYQTLARRLDDYRDRFVAAYGDACEATQLRGEQSQEAEELRMQCLAGRVNEVKALVVVFAAADRRLVDADITTLRPLPDLAACADLPRLREEGGAPADPLRFAALQAVRAEIVTAEAHRLSQQPDQLARAEAAVAAARALGYQPAVAEALLVYGRVEEVAGEIPRAEPAMFEALTVALAERHFDLAADAAASLAIDVGRVQSRYDEGRRWARLALAIVGTRDLPARVAKATFALGLIDKAQGRLDDAIASFKQSLAARERLYGAISAQVAEVLNSLGGIALDQNRLDEAHAYLSRARTIWDVLSPTKSSSAHHNLALVEHARGRERAAAALLGRQVEIGRRDQPDTVPTAIAMRHLAYIELALGHDDQALTLLDDARRVLERKLGPAHPDVARTLGELGEAHIQLGRLDEARAELERARDLMVAAKRDPATWSRIEIARADLARRQRRFAEAHALLDARAADGPVLDLLGQTLLDEGKAEDALVVLTRAAALLEPAGKPAARAWVALHLGEAQLALGRPDQACVALERGLAAVEPGDTSAAQVAMLRLRLARALWDASGDRARAITLARSAEVALRDAGPGLTAEHAEVARWLASRPP